jgi:hypothetical protein
MCFNNNSSRSSSSDRALEPHGCMPNKTGLQRNSAHKGIPVLCREQQQASAA